MTEQGVSAGSHGEIDEFQLLIGAVADYAIYRLDSGGQIVSWNLGAERINGYADDEIMGRHFSVFFAREDRLSGLPGQTLDRAARTGRCEVEGWRIRKDGGRFWAQGTLNAIR